MMGRIGSEARPLAAAVAVALGVVAALAASADYDEYKVKAAFLLNFARLVEWPGDSGPAPGEPLVVGVHGDAEAARNVARALEGASVNDHPVTVRRLGSPSEIPGSHILFVAVEDAGEAAAWLGARGNRAVLTVGEARGFAGRGGVINFFVEGNKLRFEINKKAAERNGLKISSRLLRLARLVPDTN